MLREPFKITWLDAKREPKEPANPDHPEGLDVDVSAGAARACVVSLPYPADRCGSYVIICNTCGRTAACSTAGRDDDPRSIKIACKEKLN